MKKYIISGLVVIALVFSVVTPARAATIAELQVLVAQLTAQLVSLQAQLNAQTKVRETNQNTGKKIITSPGLNEKVKVGSQIVIKWNKSLVTTDNKIQFILHLDNNVIKNITSDLSNTGSYTWTVGAVYNELTGTPINRDVVAYFEMIDNKTDKTVGASQNFYITPTTSSSNAGFSTSARFVENSQDKVGIWDVFKAGKGNASSITADWAWDITFYNNTDKLRHIKKISVLHEPTGEGWSTDYEKMYNRANGYPLLVTSPEGKTLETKYVGDIDIEIDAKSQKTFRLYGQPEGRTYKEATVWIYFADGSATSVRAGRSGMVESPITVISEPGQPVRIITDNTVYPRNVVVLPGKEELLFAIGVNTNAITYASTLEVRFKKVSGSGSFSDYTDRVDLVDQFNKTISAEGSVSYDGNTTIYKFTKLNHKIQTYGEHFYVKVKTKSDMDKSGKFTMSVPKDGLKLEGQTLSGAVTNTITFDPSYTLKKNETTVAQSYVRVITPNNGGTFNNSETVEIKYETNLNNTNSEGVTLQLYKSKNTTGSSYEPVTTITKGLKNGKYLWLIPKDLPEGEYVIYAVGQGVWAQGSSVGDFSDKAFTIKPAMGMGI